MKYIVYLIFVSSWVVDIALAKGFWITLASVVFPPLAWVLLAQHLLGIA